MIKKILLITCFVVIVGAVLFFAINGSAKKDNDLHAVAAEKGSIVDKALAVGTIVPRHEIVVKSKISGIVKKIHVDVGEGVKLGDPLMDISPDPTPLELTEARRQVEINTVTYENAQREMMRLKELNEKNLIAEQEFENAKAKNDEAKLRLNLAQEKLALIQEGQVNEADHVVENVIKSPIEGTVLARQVDVGDPVVPLTSYQAGTELMSMADMSDLMFKGTVDEIDVGKLIVGMPVELKVGALPKEKVTGTLTKVSPKARKDEGSTVFDVEINLDEIGKTLLRAGYSANADIIITKKEDILLIPERLVEFVEDSTFVHVLDSLGNITKVPVETGLSDGINIEVTSGIEEGAQLVEAQKEETES